MCTARANLKAAKYTCGNNNENLLGKPQKVTDKPITKIISNQPDIKQEQFTQEELYSVQRKIKNRKATELDEIPP